MTTLTIIIGTDTSIEDEFGDSEDASVSIEARNGTVCIVGPFDDWAGFKRLARLDSAEAGESLARRIAANPAAELNALGYGTAGWLRQA